LIELFTVLFMSALTHPITEVWMRLSRTSGTILLRKLRMQLSPSNSINLTTNLKKNCGWN